VNNRAKSRRARRDHREEGRDGTEYERQKELTDREVGKPKSNWELQGLLGLAAFVLGFLAGK
jgi:hypothetical protein